MTSVVEIFGIPGLPEIEPGTDLASLIAAKATLESGDVLVVASKVVSKAEGRIVDLDSVEPSPFAVQWAEQHDKDARVIELVLRESRRIVRQVDGHLLTETHHGFVCANAAVDTSSTGAEGRALLLPVDPDASARSVRKGLASLDLDVAVIISDTFGRPWRHAQTDVAIGIAGMAPVTSYIGQQDPHGHVFRVQALCTADELAGAAELVKGNVSRMPAAVVRGLAWERDEDATMRSVVRLGPQDLFK